MPQQCIRDQWPGPGQHGILTSQREQRAHAPPLLDLRELFRLRADQWLKNVRIVFGYFAENAGNSGHPNGGADEHPSIKQLITRALVVLSKRYNEVNILATTRFSEAGYKNEGLGTRHTPCHPERNMRI